MNDKHFCWAEAVAIDGLHSADGQRRIAEQINALTIARHEAAVERVTKIGRRYAQLPVGNT